MKILCFDFLEFAFKAFGAIAIINILGMIVSVAINQGVKSNLKFGFIVGLTLMLVSKLFAQIMIINIGNVFQLIDSQIFKFVVIISFIAEAHALVSFITSYCDEKETQEAEILYDDSVTAIPPGEGPPSYRDATKHVNYETQIVVNA